MLTTPSHSRFATLLAILTLVLAPALLLGPSVFGPRSYVPSDPARLPPASLLLDQEQRQIIDEQPTIWDVTEIPGLVLPEIGLASEELAEGRFPGWNPYARFGAPLYANGLAGMAYPPNWLLLAGDPQATLAFTTWFSFAVAGLLAFAFLRALQLRHSAALFGALVFAFGGTMAVNAHFYMRMNALIWLPGIALALLKLGQHRGRDRVPALLGLALCTGLTLSAGFPPFAVASLLAAGIFALSPLAKTLGYDGPKPMFRLSLWLLAGIGLGVMLASIQLLPSLDFFPESNRQMALPLDGVRSQGFDPMGLLGYVAPDIFASPVEVSPRYDQSALAYLLFDLRGADGKIYFPQNYNFTEYTVFLGTLPLLLALLGFIGPTHRCRHVVSASIVVMLVLATAPLGLSWAFELPVIGSVPPMRYVGPIALFGATLAAFGLDTALRGAAPKRTLLLTTLGIGAALACAYAVRHNPMAEPGEVVQAILDRYRPQAPDADAAAVLEVVGGQAGIEAAGERFSAAMLRAGWALLGAAVGLLLLAMSRHWPRLQRAVLATALILTMGELMWLAAPLNTGRQLVGDFAATPVHDFLRQQRDASAERGGITVARASKQPRTPLDLPAGTLFPERIRDLNAYAFVDPWSSRGFRELYDDGQMIRDIWPLSFPDDQRLQHPFFDLCGLRFLLSTDRLEHAGAIVGPTLEGNGRAFYIYERPDALPRAFMVPALDQVGDDDALYARLASAELQPRAGVLVLPEAAAALGPLDSPPADSYPDPRFVVDQPQRIDLELRSQQAGYLVLADTPLSGWTAAVDGQATPIARGNAFMRVIRVPAGAREVNLRYSPPSLISGLVISIFSSSFLLALGGFWLQRRIASSRARQNADPST